MILPEAKWDLLTGSCGVSPLCLQHASAVANRSEPCVMMMTEPRLGLEQDPVFRTLSRVHDHAAARLRCPNAAVFQPLSADGR